MFQILNGIFFFKKNVIIVFKLYISIILNIKNTFIKPRLLKTYYKPIIIFCVLLVSNLALAQTNDVDVERIAPKKLRKSIIESQLFMVDNIIDLSPTCPQIEDSTHYYHNYTVYFDAPIDSVWKVYNTLNPAEAWNSKIISFGFAYFRESGDFLYEGESFDQLTEGQIQFLNLRYLWGIFKLNNALELIEINEDSKMLRFCYVKYGKSEGTQIITLVEEGEQTKVIHDTYYKSDSKFRDKRLYPYFHKITVKDLHENVEKALEEE